MMFRPDGLLPPFLGNGNAVTTIAAHAPYRIPLAQFVSSFAWTPHRRNLLSRFLAYRTELHRHGVKGWQLVGGSFVNRDVPAPPKDIDLVTLIVQAGQIQPTELAQLVSPLSRAQYLCDAYVADANEPNTYLRTRQLWYWHGLFGHSRSGVWKGTVELDLNDPLEDAHAAKVLDQLPNIVTESEGA